MIKWISQFLCDEDAATAIEYGLIAGVTGLMLAAVMPAIQTGLETQFNALSAGMQ